MVLHCMDVYLSILFVFLLLGNKAVGVLRPGMVFTIEPMINSGAWEVTLTLLSLYIHNTRYSCSSRVILDLTNGGWSSMRESGRRSRSMRHNIIEIRSRECRGRTRTMMMKERIRK